MSKAHNRGTTTEWRKLREACFRVWGKTCMYCGDRATEVDHIIEVAVGGSNTIDNVQPLCKPCHMAKTAAFNTVRVRPSQSHRGVFSGRRCTKAVQHAGQCEIQHKAVEPGNRSLGQHGPARGDIAAQDQHKKRKGN